MRSLTSLLTVIVAVGVACGDSTAPDTPTPLVVDRVELSAAALSVAPNASQSLVATPRAADGSVVTGRSITWSSNDNAIVTVSGTGQVTGVSLGTGTIRATVDGKWAEANVSVIAAEPVHLAAAWRMESFDGHVVPAPYLILYNEPVGDRIVAKVEIRLDSVTKTMASNATYQRRYYFTELHDEVPMFKYGWGDHGRFALGEGTPVPLTLTSDYIQNLFTTGHVRSDGRIALSEELAFREGRRATVWVRRPMP